jgi:capsular exopolysaccharide synthesis family protein
MTMVIANSVLDEIRKLRDQGQTGILTLAAERDERIDVCFHQGMIEAVSSNWSGHRLGDYLLKDGYLQAQDLDAAASEAQNLKILFGEAVVRKGFLGQAEVGAAIRRQAMESLEHAFKHGFSVVSFTKREKSYFAPARISLPHVLLVLYRSKAEPFEPEPPTRFVLSDGIDLSVFPWNTQELSLLTELQYPNTFQGLLNGTGMVDANLKKILGVLDSLGVIEVQDTSESVPSDVLADAPLCSNPGLVKRPEQKLERLVPVVTNAMLDEKLRVARNEFSFIAEQFKNLKVQITQATSESSRKVFTVSSGDAQDGKSLVSANLAFSFAQDLGRRVIIVDCDLRNPALERYLGVTTEPGLLQYVANPHLSPYCYVRRLESLYFLTAGGIAENPIEILCMTAMKQLLECLRRDFDTIILDAPPFFPIADARVVTALSDGLLMVIRRGKTSSTSVDRAFTVIDRKKLLGVVFNDVAPMLFHTYYGSYGYGQRYMYGANPKIKSISAHRLKA